MNYLKKDPAIAFAIAIWAFILALTTNLMVLRSYDIIDISFFMTFSPVWGSVILFTLLTLIARFINNKINKK